MIAVAALPAGGLVHEPIIAHPGRVSSVL
jgi:hypothetical protein